MSLKNKESIFRLRVLAAGNGDALWIEYGDSNTPQHILVDAGTQGTSTAVRAELRKVAKADASTSHRLLVITHVDEDHIGGALALMEDPAIASQFDEVWFNGWKHLEQAPGLRSLGAVMGERLSAALEKAPGRWNASFSDGPVMRNLDGAACTKLFGAATLTILSPSAEELRKLKGKWAAEIIAAGLVPGALPRKATLGPPGLVPLGGIDVDRLAGQQEKEDTAEANGSSIAMLVEFEGKRLLLAADAHPSVLLAGIRQVATAGKLTVDVFKVAHHGSAKNVTDELLQALEAKVFVFSSNGSRHHHPDAQAVAKIIRAYKDRDIELVFNYETQYTRVWKDAALQRKWGYRVRYGNNDEGVTVDLLDCPA
ncbi:ComEC/Rec2 family competence protein [Paraburkholderia azotifigens]|uniref:Uncharacterized protein n=1 Tax=Paraburkholderia azotifigens TaxID=2057004 RepID=A0A5C6V729_9BURK|nr:MBL fold metallo-hydrolase [Paraburkholderia azotifigens]TXC81043.1 hypothetical protein FRZ40_43385 [Paraburkholderia azotifigens]